MKKLVFTCSLALLVGCIAPQAHAQLLLQQYNQTDNTVVFTTATGSGNRYALSGTIADLSQFSGTSNPFNWRNWTEYSSTSVSGGVFQGTSLRR